MRTAAALLFVLSAPRAFAYQLKHTDGGIPVRWPAGEVTMTIAVRDTPEGVKAERAERAIGEAVATWAAAMPAHVQLDAETGCEPGETGHRIRWLHQGWDDDFDTLALAMTVTTYDAGTGLITGTEILINAESFAWETEEHGAPGSACSDRYDVGNVLTHEVGHALGLGHEEDLLDATMFPEAASCEVKKRDLDADDMAGIAMLYSEEMAAELGRGQMGCSVSRRGGAGGGAVAVLALLFPLAARRRAIAGIVLPILLAAGSALATVRRAELDDLVVRSPRIVRATAVDRRVVEVNGRIYTDHLVRVSECWKGDCQGTMVVRVLGGEKDGVGMMVHDAPALDGGADLVLFLRPRRDGAFAVTGMARGAFRLAGDGLHVIRRTGGKPERLPLENLRKAARE